MAAGRRIPDWVHPRSGGAVVASRTYAPASDAPGEGVCSWSRATGGETEPEAKAPPDVRPPMMSGGRSAPSAQAAQAQETGIPMAVGEELECMRTEIVRAGLALDHEFEATVARLKPDFAALIRPRADQSVEARVPKERTLKVAAAVFGEEWAERHAKLKRSALAEAVEAAFAGTDPSVDEEGRQRAAEWALPGSRPSTRGGSATSPAGAAGARGPVAGTPGRRRRPWRRRRRQRPPTPHGAELSEARGTAETGTAVA